MFQCTEYAILGHGTTFRENDKHTHTHKFQVSANLGDYMQHVEPFTWYHVEPRFVYSRPYVESTSRQRRWRCIHVDATLY